MKMAAFALRNTKEILRDKINLFFGLGFPLVLLLFLSLLQANLPVDIFSIEHLTPGIAVFGLSFLTLFSGMLIAKDRSTAWMVRLRVSPLTSWDFVLGYTLPLLPIALMQMAITFLAAVFLGLSASINIIFALLGLVPAAVFFIGLGLLCGAVMNEKQVGGVCGALLTNLTAWLSGAWFDLSLLGGVLEKIAGCLPFGHAVNLGRAILSGEGLGDIWQDLLWVCIYAVIIYLLAAIAFLRKVREGE